MATVGGVLDRKAAPQADEGILDEVSMALWAKARADADRRMDTWVGVTEIEARRFFFLPAFGVLTGLPSPLARPSATDAILRSNAAAPAASGRVNKTAIDAFYGPANVLYVKLVQTTDVPTFDGNSHRALVRKLIEMAKLTVQPKQPGESPEAAEDRQAADIERRVLGWAIRPVDQHHFHIRYSSGRNTPKFGPRGPALKKPAHMLGHEESWFKLTGERPHEDNARRLGEREARQSIRDKRDLPKNWAAFVGDVIMGKLIVAVEPNEASTPWSISCVDEHHVDKADNAGAPTLTSRLTRARLHH